MWKRYAVKDKWAKQYKSVYGVKFINSATCVVCHDSIGPLYGTKEDWVWARDLIGMFPSVLHSPCMMTAAPWWYLKILNQLHILRVRCIYSLFLLEYRGIVFPQRLISFDCMAHWIRLVYSEGVWAKLSSNMKHMLPIKCIKKKKVFKVCISLLS